MDSSKAPVEPEPVPEVDQATAAPLDKITSRLNPSAKEWDLWVEQPPEEKRATFSKLGTSLLILCDLEIDDDAKFLRVSSVYYSRNS
ncbi:hypothetical protein QYF36_007884 [Acer negundo]|nr:hypothetical protein QYF36_001219 [Acer negundo]KAK4847992.1 hypothetical protein QYF36_007884 [Acer negundo]